MNNRQSNSNWLTRFKSLLPIRSAPKSPSPVPPPATNHPEVASTPAAAPTIIISGREQGWFRVLPADDLIRLIQAQKAVRQMWQQSRVAEPVFQRDFLPAIHRYAEYVQLMPASEAHHHAHAGGLLSHTLEMTLAAMTWRNGHFLPTNVPAEQIDAERDQWTYVVFFAALLHDIAKPMTDLRILWRGGTMSEPLRWKPIAGSLAQVGDGRMDLEYRVEFEPKAARDYQAHSRLALTLLGQIAPSSALTFLSRTPHAFDALTQYLSGHKVGLLADIVKRADQASTSHALLKGSKARFATANAVPLVDLLMQALKSMLQTGTELPLNRSGAAGWVYEGAVWFVAKRLADTTRAWINKHEPEESIPGEAKNDRLFDTWQEYGILQVNPHTGQAIWHVEIIGEGSNAEEGAEAGHQYTHSLSMLRFPLDKLYDDPALYPPAMAGRIEVKAKRGADNGQDAKSEAETDNRQDSAALQKQVNDAGAKPSESSRDKAGADSSSHTTAAVVSPKPAAKPKAQGLPAPAFSKPKSRQKPPPKSEAAEHKAPKTAAEVDQPKHVAADPASGHRTEAKVGSSPRNTDKPAAILQPNKPQTRPKTETLTYRTEPVFPPLEDAIDGFDVEDDGFLDEADSASTQQQPKQQSKQYVREPEMIGRAAVARSTIAAKAAPVIAREPAIANETPRTKKAVCNNHQETAAIPTQTFTGHSTKEKPALVSGPVRDDAADESASSGKSKSQRMFADTTPVVLTPKLPELPHEVAAKRKEPSETAMAFIQWLQRGLASREITYNETGASVHFVEEGMALVSPLIFKLYAKDTGPEEEADATGLQVQREVIKAGWHRMGQASGGGKVNILRYQVLGRGNAVVARLSAIVLIEPDRFVLPVPPANPVLKLDGG